MNLLMGANFISRTLRSQKIKASFFFTGNFYRNPFFYNLVATLKKDGHYLGAHSDKHLLYNDWSKRDSLLVTKDSLLKDLSANYAEMQKFGIYKTGALYFMPPFEWYNDSISSWIKMQRNASDQFYAGYLEQRRLYYARYEKLSAHRIPL